ncbi:MAG: hypothetical protein DRN15_05225 [Thermoprotei archaeon]|nr:MAG: hypothetical protein DRN15_05225 [Thermoprotei archaeon]RLF24643.1 MAG: hypothetical protein DRM97_03205 [Thermoprotei archaeon]
MRRWSSLGVVEVYGIIEGVYFKHVDGGIFYAKGVIHPPGGVIGFPKYIPSPRGSRVAPSGISYVKIEELRSQLRILKERYPSYLREDKCLGCLVPVVPTSDIDEIYDPVVVVNEMKSRARRTVERVAVELVSLLAEHIGWDKVGLSGSLLLGLYTPRSDIDVVVYGGHYKAYEVLKEARDKRILTGYSGDKLALLYRARSKETPIDPIAFKLHQQRKLLEGLISGFEYFIRLIDPSSEPPYCTFKTRKHGTVKVRGEVVDDSRSMMTPCVYEVFIDEVIIGPKEAYEVSKLYSLRGRFCELVQADEKFEARGSLEKVEYHDGSCEYRIYLGYEGDYLISLDLLKRR